MGVKRSQNTKVQRQAGTILLIGVSFSEEFHFTIQNDGTHLIEYQQTKSEKQTPSRNLSKVVFDFEVRTGSIFSALRSLPHAHSLDNNNKYWDCCCSLQLPHTTTFKHGIWTLIICWFLRCNLWTDTINYVVLFGARLNPPVFCIVCWLLIFLAVKQHTNIEKLDNAG